MMERRSGAVDVVMLGTFGLWTRGTLQSRALPFAQSLSRATGLRCAILTTPWDDPASAGKIEEVAGVVVVNTRATSIRSTPIAIAEQLRWIARWRPRVVHVMKPKGFGGLSALAAAKLGVRSALVVDCDDWEGDGGWNDAGGYGVLSRRLFASQESQLIRDADHVTAASTLLVERCRRLRGPARAGDVTFLPNGLDSSWLDELAGSRRAPSPAGERSILLYSRFAEFTSGWLAAFCECLGRRLNTAAYLDIVGETGAADLPRTENGMLTIRDHGYVARERIPGLLGHASVAIYPYEDTLINRSKQSVKLLELMAAGCPIAASDVGDVERVAGSAVELVEAAGPEAFSDATAALLADERRRSDLSRAARQRARDFTIDRLVDRLAAVYRAAGARL